MKINNFTISDINEGDVFEFEKVITREMVMDFARLSGDLNPLHVDEEFGQKSEFKQNIVHGMLAGSFFSTIVGMYCPGKHSLYLSQTLNFRSPIFYNDEVLVRGTVKSKSDALGLVVISMEIIKGDKVVINGEAKVMLSITS